MTDPLPAIPLPEIYLAETKWAEKRHGAIVMQGGRTARVTLCGRKVTRAIITSWTGDEPDDCERCGSVYERMRWRKSRGLDPTAGRRVKT